LRHTGEPQAFCVSHERVFRAQSIARVSWVREIPFRDETAFAGTHHEHPIVSRAFARFQRDCISIDAFLGEQRCELGCQ
jgi:hypothetical protein